MREVKFTVQPYDQWPREKTSRHQKRSSFRAGLTETRQKLTTEICKLGAREAVIQINVRPQDLRNDGQLRATARPEYEGVILSFESKHGPLKYTCDAFSDWESNLRGIALTLERLRLAELYGCAESGEQYKGWAQLPPPPDFVATAAPFKDAHEALVWAAKESGHSIDLIKAVPGTWKFVYRELAKRFHPDTGGSTEKFQKLQYADNLVKEILPR